MCFLFESMRLSKCVWTPAEQGLPVTSSYSIRADGDTLLLGTGAGVFRKVGAADWPFP